MNIHEEVAELETPTGAMRTYVYSPATPAATSTNERNRPGIVFFSEIFQQTGPIKRAASILAGNGYVVAVPEIFHELEPAGSVIPYDQGGADRGNSHKTAKTIDSYDSDASAALAFLANHPKCSGKLGSFGICIGGHLSFRAAMNPAVKAAACFYATDIHKSSLGRGMKDDSLARIGDINGELMMVWGRQDPHIPVEGRQLIYQALTDAETNFSWHEFNAAHAFLRDEGPRYDPELALICYQMALRLFARNLS